MEAFFGILFESSVRAVIIAIAVSCALLALKVSSPKILHRVWAAVLISMLLLPLAGIWAPRITVTLFPPESVTAQAVPNPQTKFSQAPFLPVAAAPPAVSASGGERHTYQPGSYEIAFGIYAAGLMALLARLLVGMALSAGISRGAAPAGSVFFSARCRVPLTVGLIRPRILLPPESEHWPLEKLDAVLDHEKEHVRRRDPLFEWVAMLNRCIYWFHPLAWWLRRRLSTLAEQACDEAVLARGHEPGIYAELLVELARSAKLSGKMVAVWGSPVSGGALATRVRRIVERDQSSRISRTRAVIVTATCAAAILIPSSVTLVRAQKPSSADSLTLVERQNAITWRQAEATTTPAALPAIVAADTVSMVKNALTPSAVFQTDPAHISQSISAPEARSTSGNSLQTSVGERQPAQGVDQYKNFVIFFPADPKARDAPLFFPAGPKAQDAPLKIIGIRMRQIDSSDPELKELAAALAEIQKFLANFPNSEYAPQLRQWLDEIKAKIADRERIESLSEYYRKWLKEDVAYLITKEEEDAFLALATSDEREHFIEQFWARRNPAPNGPDNPMKTEHYRRLAYANQRFSCRIPGWKTDRGHIYILYGEPDSKETHPQIGVSLTGMRGGVGGTRVYPYERWHYNQLANGGPADFWFEDAQLDGCFPLQPSAPSASEPLRGSELIFAQVVRIARYFKSDGGAADAESSAVPRSNSEYSNGQSVNAYLQVFNAEIDSATGKPNLQVSYLIVSGNQVIANIEDSEGQTCALVGNKVIINRAILLKDLPPGKYSLRVRVNDRLTTRTYEASAAFTVVQ